MRKRPYRMDLERAKMTSCQKSSRIHQIHITGDAQDTLFSPRQLTAFMSCLDVPGHLLRPLESDGDCRRGCWGLLTHRKLGAMTRRAEKPTWHISRCRHIRTDIFFDCETLFGVPTWQHVPTWQPAARPLWRLSGWRLPRWDLGGLCWEIAMKQIILMTNEIQWNPIYSIWPGIYGPIANFGNRIGYLLCTLACSNLFEPRPIFTDSVTISYHRQSQRCRLETSCSSVACWVEDPTVSYIFCLSSPKVLIIFPNFVGLYFARSWISCRRDQASFFLPPVSPYVAVYAWKFRSGSISPTLGR